MSLPSINPRTGFASAAVGTMLLGLTALVPACTGPQSETCDSGIVCPLGSTCAANQDTCIYNDCGNGIKDTSEVCDDGNIENGDGCSADCLSSEGCGDGIKNEEAGETCDDGNTENGDGCAANCRSLEKCGNKVIDFGEMCDDGNNESGDGCKDDCSSDERCGNGREDFHIGEVCDDGNRINNDGCSNACISTEDCGNKIVDRGEECDDENDNNHDGCIIAPNALCKIAYCGDGFVLETPTGPGTAKKEDCDGDGKGKGGATSKCNADCTAVKSITSGAPAGCGDGVINSVLGEECDDGARNGQYLSCTSQCKLTGIAECGDERVNGPEACDQGELNGTGYGFCKADCSGFDGECGDGKTHADEHCDSGPQNGEYGFCNDLCTADGPFCGDTTRQVPYEACDDGPGAGYDRCKDDCSGIDQFCGDGTRQTLQEACDHGALFNGRYGYCNSSCSGLGARCGNGGTPESRGDGTTEACDDGSNNGDYGFCKSDCTGQGPYCGDGDVTRSEEACDPAGDDDLPSQCHNDCSGYCGDGQRNDIANGSTANFEGCDYGLNAGNGNGTQGDGPEVTHCRSNCTRCGDTRIQNGETCDLGEGNNVSYRQNGNSQSCNADCSGAPGYCGDGFVWNGSNRPGTGANEECDPPGSQDPPGMPTRTCNASCRWQNL